MNRKALIGALLWAAVAGGVVALMTGDQRAVSLGVWLAVSALWFTVAALKELQGVVPLLPSRFLSLFGRKRSQADHQQQLRQLRSLDSLIMRSRENSRAFEQQLRPRLTELGDHYLKLNHNVDPASEPERAQAVLGPVAWLVDPTQTNREPTIDELGQFISILTGSTASSREIS